jgi:hypothetical protein
MSFIIHLSESTKDRNRCNLQKYIALNLQR